MALLTQRALDYIADNLEYYIHAHSIAVILDGGCSEKRYKEGMDRVNKALKKLRNGKCNSKIFDMEMLEVFADSIEREAKASNE